MSFQSWMLWPDNVAVSVLLLALLAMAFMYAARRPTHELLRSLGHMIGGPLRVASRWLSAAAAEINNRNKAVLLAHGKQEVGQRIEREFERLGAVVTRDLQGYPTLQRKLLDEITKIEEDYKKCGEVPPSPPDWTEAVAAIGTDKAQHALTVSGFTQFAIALVVMAIAAGGAFINFKLIALPMSEMVGAGDYITSSLRTSEVAALVIIFVEAS